MTMTSISSACYTIREATKKTEITTFEFNETNETCFMKAYYEGSEVSKIEFTIINSHNDRVWGNTVNIDDLWWDKSKVRKWAITNDIREGWLLWIYETIDSIRNYNNIDNIIDNPFTTDELLGYVKRIQMDKVM